MGNDYERYRQRAAAGFCPQCGGMPEFGRKLCAACLAQARAGYYRRRNRGVCVQCGGPVEQPGRCRCNACRDFLGFKRSGDEVERWERRERAYERKSIETQARCRDRDAHGRLTKVKVVRCATA